MAMLFLLLSLVPLAMVPAVHSDHWDNNGDQYAATYADGACTSSKAAFYEGETVHGGVSGTDFSTVIFVYRNGAMSYETPAIAVTNGSACDAAGYAPPVSSGKWTVEAKGCKNNDCDKQLGSAKFTYDSSSEATYSDPSCQSPASSFNEGSMVWVGGVIGGKGGERGHGEDEGDRHGDGPTWNVNILYPASRGGTAASYSISETGPYCVGYDILPTDPAGTWTATLTNSTGGQIQPTDPDFTVIQPLPDLPVGILPIAFAVPVFYLMMKRRAVAHP